MREHLLHFSDDALSLVRLAQKELRLTDDAVGSAYDLALIIAEMDQEFEVGMLAMLNALTFLRLGGLGGVLDDCGMCRRWREISARFEDETARERILLWQAAKNLPF